MCRSAEQRRYAGVYFRKSLAQCISIQSAGVRGTLLLI